MSLYHVTAPLAATDVLRLYAGDIVRLDGVIYTLRDAGHARLLKMLVRGERRLSQSVGCASTMQGPAPAPREKYSAPAVRPVQAAWISIHRP